MLSYYNLVVSIPIFYYNSISINTAKKFNQWYIKTDSKLLIG